MGIWDKLKDKVEKKKTEVQKKAMEAAAEAAFQKTKDTAKSALDGMGKKIEDAIFGTESEKSEDEKGPREEREPPRGAKNKDKAPRASSAAAAASSAPKEPLTRDYDKFVMEREAKERALEKAVDDDLAALKKKLGKK